MIAGAIGYLMGIGNTVLSLGRVIGPIWAGVAFDLDPRYPYLSGAVILGVGFVISLLGLPHIEYILTRNT